jgi:hypothetical protein
LACRKYGPRENGSVDLQVECGFCANMCKHVQPANSVMQDVLRWVKMC